MKRIDFMAGIRVHLSEHRTFFKNFIRLMFIIFLIIAILAIFIYENSRRIIEEELMRTNINVTQNVANSLDNLLSDMCYITATLFTNDMVRFYIASDSPAEVFDGFHERIKEQLKAYVYAFRYIESIYLYAPEKMLFFDALEEQSIYSMRDTGWLQALPETDRIVLVPRKVRDIYPFVITVINRTTISNRTGYIAVNVNLRRLPNILDSTPGSSSEIYIVTNDSKVLYRKHQEDVNESVEAFSELSAFEPDRKSASQFVNDPARPYVFTQIASKDYDWNYVTVTYLHEYVSRLSGIRAVLLVLLPFMLLVSCCLALLLSLSCYRPVRDIINLLNNPDNWDVTTRKSEEDIREAAKKIVSYIQTSNKLSSELKARLNVLNQTQIWALQSQINPHFITNTLNLIHLAITESLGYSHVASQMTIYLGRLMSIALDSTSLVSLRVETEYANVFMEILKKRYEDRIETSYAIGPDTEDALVPKLILQPLIENAIQHGMRIEEAACLNISITSARQTVEIGNTLVDAVLVKVTDDGKGIPPEKLHELRASLRAPSVMPQAHIGLKNVAMRFSLLYGEAFSMDIESKEGNNTSVLIKFPYSIQQNNGGMQHLH